jgi:predicted Zn-dependent protease
MQSYFYELADFVWSKLEAGEIATTSFQAEDSEFVRFNKSSVRQAGSVVQREIEVELIRGKRHAKGSVTLTGGKDADRVRVASLIGELRVILPLLPEDPHLLYSEEMRSGEKHGENRLPAGTDAVGTVLTAGGPRDLVGLYAGGGIHSGFANSLGQRNWFSTYTFNLDWSLYHHEDKAVKCAYAGFSWDEAELAGKMAAADEQLAILTRPAQTIDPGSYRVFLSPFAIYDILGTVSWGGFGLKDHRTKHTSLLKMVEDGARLHPGVEIVENTAEGVAPDFQSAGFIKPPRVDLISRGCFSSCLISPRSAKEYGVPTNGASLWEMPASLDMASGNLPRDQVLGELGDGLFINNVHYLNYSDRPACRMTGMTRFATFQVKNGKITAPVNVMRFDETIYRILGEHLVGLTAEREFILDSHTYGGRSVQSGRVPGALVKEFTFTL